MKFWFERKMTIEIKLRPKKGYSCLFLKKKIILKNGKQKNKYNKKK